jgi:hypothetical protein
MYDEGVLKTFFAGFPLNPRSYTVHVYNVCTKWFRLILFITKHLGNCSIRGLALKHSSKSVANNYGVYIHNGSDLWLESCDVCSTSGCGIGIEDAQPLISKCRCAFLVLYFRWFHEVAPLSCVTLWKSQCSAYTFNAVSPFSDRIYGTVTVRYGPKPYYTVKMKIRKYGTVPVRYGKPVDCTSLHGHPFWGACPPATRNFRPNNYHYIIIINKEWNKDE